MKSRIFCSLECNREYHAVAFAYPGDGDEAHCVNCGDPLIAGNENDAPEGS